MRVPFSAVIGVAAIVLAAAACGSSSTATTGSGSSGGGSALKTATISGATVLTNAQGFTLYWFVPDTPTESKCTASCAAAWPPVAGPATAGSGVTGTLSVITRPDGSKQATWNGHPLYTFAGDSGPGQNKGDGINANGGLWHEVSLSGSQAPAGGTSSSHSGYGY